VEITPDRIRGKRMKVKRIKKLKLYGFNNLTKTLSFNMYDICYAKNAPASSGVY